MKKLCLLFAVSTLLAASCAGGSSHYGCPEKSGHSCKSVSEVYAETTSGGGSSADILRKSPGKKKRARAAPDAGRKLHKGRKFRAGRYARGRAGSAEAPRAGDAEAMPIYLPPSVIRLWIAPWQDARGVFHSGKYVYVLSGRGQWTIGGKTVPLGGPEGEHPGNIRLLGTGRAP